MNYFSQALRTLSRMPGYTALSLIGLVISLSGTVIITRFLHQEWTIDSWMPDMDRTYLLSGTYDNGYNELTDNYEVFYDGTNTPTISPIKDQSEIECVTTLKLRNKLKLKVADDEQMDIKAVGVDSLFQKFYPLKAVEGTLDLRRDGLQNRECFALHAFPRKG